MGAPQNLRPAGRRGRWAPQGAPRAQGGDRAKVPRFCSPCPAPPDRTGAEVSPPPGLSCNGLLQAGMSPSPVVVWLGPSHQSRSPWSPPRKSIFNLGTMLMPSITDSPLHFLRLICHFPLGRGAGPGLGLRGRTQPGVGLGSLACVWGFCYPAFCLPENH